MYKANILIIDDEPDLVELLKYNLAKEGYKVEFAFNGFDGLRASEVFKPDLLILDIMLPDINGYEVCKRIKRTSDVSPVPIIFLSAKQEEVDKVLGFESGAEDYITKPFSVAELMARIRTILRRVPPANSTGNGKTEITSDDFGFKNITVNVLKHSVMVRNTEIKLSPIEFKKISLKTFKGTFISKGTININEKEGKFKSVLKKIDAGKLIEFYDTEKIPQLKGFISGDIVTFLNLKFIY